MLLYFRFLMSLIWILLRKKAVDPHKPFELIFHVLPTDLDFFMHMNNARYASFADILRTKFLLETGLYKNMKSLGALPIMGTTYSRFRKPLKLFDKFTVRVEVAYMSPRWIYFDVKFIKGDFVYCHVLEKYGAALPGKGMVPPHKLLPPIPGSKDFPAPPPHIVTIMAAEDEMRLVVRKES